MGNQNGLQLLPETRRSINISEPGENRLFVFGVVILILVIAGLVGGYMYRQKLTNQIVTLDNQISSVEKSRDKIFENKFSTLNKQLALVNQLVNDHRVWSQALARIENHTQPQVQFTNFSADETKISFTGLAAGYSVLAKQIASFGSDDAVTNIRLGNVRSRTDGRIEFSTEVQFDKNKLIINQAQ